HVLLVHSFPTRRSSDLCPISYRGRASGTTRGRGPPYFPSVQRIPGVVHSNWLKTWRRQPTEDSTTRGGPTARIVARRKSGIRTRSEEHTSETPVTRSSR